MNLEHLFSLQRELDDHIIKEKHLEGQDLLPNKILALQVELGKLANEWRGFKHWSNDQEMRRDKALVEYVDCLHFILSIGLSIVTNDEFDYDDDWDYLHELNIPIYTESEPIKQFRVIFNSITMFSDDNDLEEYQGMFLYFIGLGVLLGFSWNEIEQAYMDKNKVNHKRQETGY